MVCVFCLAPATEWDGPGLSFCHYCWSAGSTCHARHFLFEWCRYHDAVVKAYYMDPSRTQFWRILEHDWSKDVYVEDRF